MKIKEWKIRKKGIKIEKWKLKRRKKSDLPIVEALKQNEIWQGGKRLFVIANWKTYCFKKTEVKSFISKHCTGF